MRARRLAKKDAREAVNDAQTRVEEHVGRDHELIQDVPIQAILSNLQAIKILIAKMNRRDAIRSGESYDANEMAL